MEELSVDDHDDVKDNGTSSGRVNQAAASAGDDIENNVTTTTTLADQSTTDRTSRHVRPLPHPDRPGRTKKPRARQRNRQRLDTTTTHPDPQLFHLTIRIVSLPVKTTAAAVATGTACGAAHEQQQDDQHNNYRTDEYPSSSSILFLRLIEPYPYTFVTHAKQRWVGRTILDVHSSEFQSYPASYYRHAIEQGRIQVQSTIGKQQPSTCTAAAAAATTAKIVTCDYLIQGTDLLRHTVHRHEPAVQVTCADVPYVTILAETPNVLCINKPGTMPVHPCGGYHQNSLIPLLERALYQQQQQPQQQSQKLYAIHRLDRLTSGLVILAKRSEVARDWAKALQERHSCTKLYLARVRGRFPLQAGEIPRLSQQQQQQQQELPVFGEWSSGDAVDQKEKKSSTLTPHHAARQARLCNAYGYWMTEQQSAHQASNVVVTNASLDEFAETQHSLNDWLQALSPQPETETQIMAVDICTATDRSSSSSSSSPLVWLHLACPVRIAHHKDGVCESGIFAELDDTTYLSTVKAAQTSFAVLRYDQASDSTVVLCRPGTGRTHQIRIHLQQLGHPIANDPNYGGEMWYADPQGAKACQQAKEFLEAMDQANRQPGDDDSSPLLPECCLVTTDVPATEDEIKHMTLLPQRETEECESDFMQRTCVWCARTKGRPEERTKMEFLVRSRGIWLHALQYQVQVGGDQAPVCFSAPPPAWSLL